MSSYFGTSNADLIHKMVEEGDSRATCVWNVMIYQIVKWIALVFVYPGELEQEALAGGALRVLRGEEKAKKYSGKPVWSGFEDGHPGNSAQ